MKAFFIVLMPKGLIGRAIKERVIFRVHEADF
jgi:hypothetical protein